MLRCASSPVCTHDDAKIAERIPSEIDIHRNTHEEFGTRLEHLDWINRIWEILQQAAEQA